MNNDYVITVESIIYKYYVKYDTLNSLISFAYKGSDAKSINIYIDLYGLYHTLYSRHYTTTITDYVSFTVQVINMCAHYRNYFKYLNVHTKIFLISSTNTPIHSIESVPEYNNVMVDKLKNKAIADMMSLDTNLLELLCPYLPDIFYLSTTFESSVLINELINREGGESLIISTDLYPIQLCALRDHVSFIWPRKVYDGDISLICPPITHREHRNAFWSIITRKYGNSFTYEKMLPVATSNLALVGALNRFPDRNFKTITNITRAYNIITSTLGYNDNKLAPNTLFQLVPKLMKDLDPDILNRRYQALDLQFQSLLFNDTVEQKTIHYENLEDPEAVRMINDQYFKDNPIDIFRL